MKIIFRQIVNSIINFFDRIIDKEKQRVFEFNSRVFEREVDEAPRIYRMVRGKLALKEVRYKE